MGIELLDRFEKIEGQVRMSPVLHFKAEKKIEGGLVTVVPSLFLYDLFHLVDDP